MKSITTLKQLADVTAMYFQGLVVNTHTCLTQFYNDGETYKYYFSRYPLIYMFHFIDELCNKYSFKEYDDRYAILMHIFTKCFNLSDEEAKEGTKTATNLGLGNMKRNVEEDWQLGLIIYRLALRDVEEFTFEKITKQQIDNFNLLLLIDKQPES